MPIIKNGGERHDSYDVARRRDHFLHCGSKAVICFGLRHDHQDRQVVVRQHFYKIELGLLDSTEVLHNADRSHMNLLVRVFPVAPLFDQMREAGDRPAMVSL